MSTELITAIINITVKAIFGIMGIVFTYYVIPILKKYLQETWVRIAVRAAEKIYKESGMGLKKKEYVIKLLVGLKLFKLDENGNPPEAWNALIEATVKELDIIEGNLGDLIQGETDEVDK